MNKRIQEILVQCQHESIDGPECPRWTDLEKFAELIVQEVLSLQNRHGNIKPKKVREHFGVQDPDVPTEDEAKAAYDRLVAAGIIRPHERTLEGAEKDSVYEIILQSIPHSVSNNQRSITEEYTVSGKRYDLHWFGEGDYMIVEINK